MKTMLAIAVIALTSLTEASASVIAMFQWEDVTNSAGAIITSFLLENIWWFTPPDSPPGPNDPWPEPNKTYEPPDVVVAEYPPTHISRECSTWNTIPASSPVGCILHPDGSLTMTWGQTPCDPTQKTVQEWVNISETNYCDYEGCLSYQGISVVWDIEYTNGGPVSGTTPVTVFQPQTVVLLAGPTPSGPWTPVDTNTECAVNVVNGFTYQPSAPSQFFRGCRP